MRKLLFFLMHFDSWHDMVRYKRSKDWDFFPEVEDLRFVICARPFVQKKYYKGRQYKDTHDDKSY